MRNDSTGQFEGRECLEAASSLSMGWLEVTALLQHGSYMTGCKQTTNTAFFLEQTPKEECYTMPRLLSSHVASYLYRKEKTHLYILAYLLTYLVA